MFLSGKLQFEAGAVPIDTTGAAVATDVVSLKNYRTVTFAIMQGAWAGGTPAVTLKQYKTVDNSPDLDKALSFAQYKSKVGLTGTTYTTTAVSSDTFNLTATANTITLVEVEAESLDTSNGYDGVQLCIASPGANADLIGVLAILGEPRYIENPLPDPKVD